MTKTAAVLLTAGAAAIVAGVYLLSVAAAAIVGGLLLAGLGVLCLEFPERDRR